MGFSFSNIGCELVVQNDLLLILENFPEFNCVSVQAKDHLPVPMDDETHGAYRIGDMQTVAATFYRVLFPEDFDGMADADLNPFSEKLFEALPLNRVEKQAAPGKDWALGESHEIEFEYVTGLQCDKATRGDL